MLKTTAGGAAANGTLTEKLTAIKTELDSTGATSLAGKIDKAQAGQALDFKDAYTKFKTAVEDATNIIDKALESNDLTELDTTNLKALRSYITETKATFDNALKDSGLDATKENADVKVTAEALDKLKAGLNSATEIDTKIQDSLAKAIDDAIKGAIPPANDLDFSAAYTKFKKTITDSTDIIDEALDKNDLTELDTTNLKAIRSYLTDTLTTVDTAIKDSGLKADAANDKGTVTKEKLEKIQSGLDSAAELGKTASTKGGYEYSVRRRNYWYNRKFD